MMKLTTKTSNGPQRHKIHCFDDKNCGKKCPRGGTLCLQGLASRANPEIWDHTPLRPFMAIGFP